MSEEQRTPANAARRGGTGADRTARDWVGSNEPEPPEYSAGPDVAAGPGTGVAPAGEATGGRGAGDSAVGTTTSPADTTIGPVGASAGPRNGSATGGSATNRSATGGSGPRSVVRATGPPRRPAMVVQGLWPALLAGALLAATVFGLLPLAVAVLGLQVFLVLGALALLDAPASGGAFLVATATTVAADVVVLTGDGRITGLAGVVGLGLVASLVHQLVRRGRSRVTESLADTLVVLVVSVAAACLLALRQVDGGEQVLLVSLAAAGGVLLLGRIGDWIAPRPMLAVGSTRGWPGLLLGLGAGMAVAVAVADAGLGDGNLPLHSAALLGLVIASTVATADLAVDLGAAELRAGWRDARRVAALRPTALLLPYAVLGPIALLAGRLVLP
ncbi:MAG: hypothetical protein WD794_00205 [Mycobacteriales bacterium]